MSVVLVTHDLGIVAETCDRVAVLYSGRYDGNRAGRDNPLASGAPVHAGPDQFGSTRKDARQHLTAIPGTPPDPLHLPSGCRFAPRCILASPDCAREQPGLRELVADHVTACIYPHAVGRSELQLRRMMAETLLRADDLMRSFPVRGIAWRGRRPVVRALNGVTLSVARGETLAVVGESGCGKSTLARALVRLIELDSGQIYFAGADVRGLQGDALRRYNRHVQLIFQDPYGSLNPRMTVERDSGGSSTGTSDRPAIRPDSADRRTSVTSAAASRRNASGCRTSFRAGSASASRSRVPCQCSPIC